mmetsp:Transcript_3583/g.8553  ORF Transcript_3583/g.8553 Transcript_3583/m.8553 type:complete len:466 (-) Transcript_3583:93-1490(-)
MLATGVVGTVLAKGAAWASSMSKAESAGSVLSNTLASSMSTTGVVDSSPLFAHNIENSPLDSAFSATLASSMSITGLVHCVLSTEILSSMSAAGVVVLSTTTPTARVVDTTFSPALASSTAGLADSVLSFAHNIESRSRGLSIVGNRGCGCRSSSFSPFGVVDSVAATLASSLLTKELVGSVVSTASSLASSVHKTGGFHSSTAAAGFVSSISLEFIVSLHSSSKGAAKGSSSSACVPVSRDKGTAEGATSLCVTDVFFVFVFFLEVFFFTFSLLSALDFVEDASVGFFFFLFIEEPSFVLLLLLDFVEGLLFFFFVFPLLERASELTLELVLTVSPVAIVVEFLATMAFFFLALEVERLVPVAFFFFLEELSSVLLLLERALDVVLSPTSPTTVVESLVSVLFFFPFFLDCESPFLLDGVLEDFLFFFFSSLVDAIGSRGSSDSIMQCEPFGRLYETATPPDKT